MKYLKTTFNRLLVLFLIVFTKNVALSQDYNNDPKISYINHTAPKSPESTSFEKYGNTPVGSYTGTAQISVPLHNIVANGKNFPISASYHASGIKVSQEATWVGLGWDLTPAGRITLEIKGGYDKYTKQYLQQTQNANIVKYLFAIGNMGNQYTAPVTGTNKVFSPSYNILGMFQSSGEINVYYGANVPTDKGFDRQFDYYQFVDLMTKYGITEPDIFHVNVMGKCFDFYEDLLTGKLVVKGENNLYNVSKIDDNLGISGAAWGVTDDEGVSYFFEQKEDTFYNSPQMNLYTSITTGWLLTKIKMPNGELINLTYNNYGEELATPAISESETFTFAENGTLGVPHFRTMSNKEDGISIQYQKPYYLTRIETKNQQVDFTLGLRNDIGGAGARKLESIQVSDKLTSQLIKKVVFNYDYFNAAGDDGFYMNPALLNFPSPTNTSIENRLKLRLKLGSMSIYGSDTTQIPQTYRFSYNPLELPNKVSTSQDHWGYYNGVNNIKNVAAAFTPGIQSLIDEGLLPSSPFSLYTSSLTGSAIYQNFYPLSVNDWGHANRKANINYAGACMLTSVIYPTGGWTNYEYELHSSFYKTGQLNGGGLRVKRISDFSAANEIAKLTSYEYINDQGNSSGVYLGTIDYFNQRIYKDEWLEIIDYPWGPQVNSMNWPTSTSLTLFSNGVLSNDGPLVGYSFVRETNIDYTNSSKNGYVVKRFNANSANESLVSITDVPNTIYLPLNTQNTHLAGANRAELDGLLTEVKEYNSTNVLIKSTINHYTQHNLLDTIYSMKVTDNKLRQDPNCTNTFFMPICFYEPVRSYRTTLDSITTTLFDLGAPIKTKVAQEYNTFNQIERTIASTSDGGKITVDTKTPLSYTSLPALPGTQDLVGNALAVQNLRMKYLYNIPVESIVKKTGATGTTTVVKGVYQKFDNEGNVSENFRLETAAPVPVEQYQLSNYVGIASNYDISYDTRFKSKQSASYYYPANLLKQLVDNGKSTAYIWDTGYDYLLAMSSNALHSDVAYTSFETAEAGNWTINGGNLNTSTAYTGKNSYSLNGGSISKGGLSVGNYIVSYWTSAGSFSVNGTSAVTGQIANGWTFQRHLVTVSANGAISVTGSGTIDELRLYPQNAEMTTYTYQPFVGITSVTDAKSQSTFYDYDSFGRLIRVKDQSGNIIKHNEYHYVNTSTITPQWLYFNEPLTSTLYKTCPSGQLSTSVSYTVAGNKYHSFISQTDANQQAGTEMGTVGQNYANANCTCYTPVMATVNYYLPAGKTFTLTFSGGGHNYDYSITGSGSITDLPQGTYYVRINEQAYNGSYNFNLNGATENGVVSTTFADALLTISGTIDLTVTNH
ncbi:MAG: DUF5977 domain-containing protein [Bacteroidota bacterium]